MKILGIVASPRKGGNTEILVTEALDAARKAGAETEIVLIAGKKIGGCEGCGSCRNSGECKIKDDMQPIYKQIDAADGILFGSPVYFHNVTSQAKAIMDRTFKYLPNHGLQGKVAAPVLALRRVGAGSTRNSLYGFFMSHGMVALRGSIGYGRAPGDVQTGVAGAQDLTAIQEARATGEDVVAMLKKLGRK